MAGFIARLGIGRWLNYKALQTLLAGITVRFATLKTWWAAEMAVRGAFWVMFMDWVADKLDIDYSWLEDKWDEYGGDFKSMMLDWAQQFVCNAINEAASRLGVQTNVTRIYPLDDPQVLEDLLFELGKLPVKAINDKFGTSFASVYPVEQFVEQIKAQFMVELQSGSERFLSKHDKVGLINGLNKLRDKMLVGDTQAQGGIVIADVTTISEELAYRRYLARERQRKYRLTHERVTHAWKKKGT